MDDLKLQKWEKYIQEKYMENTLQKWQNYVENILFPVIMEATKENNFLEGNIFCVGGDTRSNLVKCTDKFYPKRANLYIAASQENVIDILEIGFNSGFSSLLMLLTNPKVRLTCVDINDHKYVIPCYEALKKDFGERINLVTGDSNKVVPTIDKKFDLIHIDGCHDELIAENDILNCLKLCKPGTTIIMDDTQVPHLNVMWKKYINDYNLKDVDFDILPTEFHDIKKY